ncbi:MAG: hypothetical protein IPM95_03820 [Sphingobacteriales bacterium]|nr:hypothetical protein [Sphingobacteriales bacterium]
MTVTVSLLFISCGKETNDENILYRTFNRTVTNTTGGFVIDSLDLNGDTYVDAAFLLFRSTSSDSAVCALIGRNSSASLVDSTQSFGSLFFSKLLERGQVPVVLDPIKKEWAKGAFFASRISAVTLGIAGAGDKFIPVAIDNPLTTQYHYGWVRINVSADLKTIQVIDGAYNYIPDVPVEMGAK